MIKHLQKCTKIGSSPLQQRFHSLQQRLLAPDHPAHSILVVMEATGSYWMMLATTLAQAGFAVSVINPAMYWMHLDILAVLPLTTLDQFLRDTWLECCGHLSAFEIDGLRYVGDEGFTDWGEGRERTMQIPCGDVLHPGQSCSYEYDFGSTTELTIKVISERETAVAEKRITVLARNTLPPLPCETCGKPAMGTCWEWLDDNEVGMSLCATCAKEHDGREASFVPLVNSPREGVCGYTGPASPYRW